ncbi:MAG: GDP-mannose 4,6-dehydratase [Anaerolineaceae bacterium]|nr:GDP-mannose 4,6-dehydratase [Anaerolineaceae bacterium]MBN2676905.1 GDP-mannose 4,6-dehydratase [Anaerolineaceae bacterium]
MKALITGISGQDGSYLAELLLSKGYEVHGVVMRSELEDPERALWRIAGVKDQVTLHPGSIEAFPSINQIVEKVQPDECYHLAASSFVSYSFDEEFAIFNSNVNGTHNILAIIKKLAPKCKFYFAGSSELFGRVSSYPQNENTPFHPRSAYGITKATGYYLTCNYRDNYDMFACNGILYNHESVRRGYEFVTRKITRGAAQIKLGISQELLLGNLEAKRDWGYAPDYVRAMWLMMQQDHPEDYVIATGNLHTVREVCEIAFNYLGLDYHKYVKVDPKFFRPSEDVPLVGDSSKARQKLGWKPEKEFQKMIEEILEFDLSELR